MPVPSAGVLGWQSGEATSLYWPFNRRSIRRPRSAGHQRAFSWDIFSFLYNRCTDWFSCFRERSLRRKGRKGKDNG